MDAIIDQQTGLLAKKNDVQDLAGLMKLLSLDSELRQTLGFNAYERTQEYFSSEIITAAWLQFYKKALVQ
ncbi:glycosyltransferase family 4 protein [Polynucleobacter paneuropaeus]|uniref:Glycosyltransferase family 4 protein n=1 Tax=Polynucleobacter paneuropaeus TaxID=2527775 RepID=A0A9Q2ZW64_9BURK|nr:glycosyltransferase family 4 protein [Polynucleobacter paneuropaeus]